MIKINMFVNLLLEIKIGRNKKTMKAFKIKEIKPNNKKKKNVYDIHHKISQNNFYDSHPNIIVNNGTIISNCSRHAGGIVITDNAMNEMPLIKAKGGLQTPWPEGLNGRYLEDYGFLKFDILGLGTLRMIEETIKKILIKQGIKNPTFEQIKNWYDEHLDSQSEKFHDIKVYEHVFWNSNYLSIFQFVKNNVQNFMKKMKPTCINDIAIATSIFRPAGLSIGLDKLYLGNRANPDAVDYKHPLIKEVLESTSNCIIFQEQTQLLFNKLAAVPLEQTDGVRKTLTKKDITNKEKVKKELDELKQQFITRSKEKNNIPETITDKLFSDILTFSSYGFNKCLDQDTLVKTTDSEGSIIKVKKIKDVTCYDHVLSRDEKTKKNIIVKVKTVHKNGIKKLYKFKLDNGKEVICTLDHKFRTIDGLMLPIKIILEKGLEIEEFNKKE